MASVTWTGMDDLMTALRTLPEHLTDEAQGIVRAAADETLSTIASAYAGHVISGNLQRGLKRQEQAAGRYGVAYRVVSASPHAWWFEHGTMARHTATGASRGAMWGGPRPAGHVVVPTAVRVRTQMNRHLVNMLEREGLLVTGSVTA
jgi:hypothetical protein